MTVITAPATPNIMRPATIKETVKQAPHQNAQNANPVGMMETRPHAYPQAESIPTSQAPTIQTVQPQTHTNVKTPQDMAVTETAVNVMELLLAAVKKDLKIQPL